MKRIMLAILGTVLAVGVGVVHAQGAAKGAGKGAAAQAPKGPSAEEKALDRAVANYKKNKGMAMDGKAGKAGRK